MALGSPFWLHHNDFRLLLSVNPSANRVQGFRKLDIKGTYIFLSFLNCFVIEAFKVSKAGVHFWDY